MGKKSKNINAQELLCSLYEALDDPALDDGQKLELLRSAAMRLDAGGADNDSRAAVWNAVGMFVYRTGGGVKQEEICYGYALNLLRGIKGGGNDEQLAVVLSNYAECMQRSGRWKKAEKFFEEAADRYFAIGNFERFAQTAGSRAECALKLGGARSGASQLSGYMKKLGKAEGEEKKRALGELLVARAVMNGSSGRKRAAVRDFSKAIRICSGGMYDLLMNAYAGRSVTNEALGRYSAAMEDAMLAVEMTGLAFPEPDDLYNSEMSGRCHVIGRLEEKRGRLESAAKYYTYAANFMSCCSPASAEALHAAEREAMAAFRAAWCHTHSSGLLYYDALLAYERALALLETLPEEISAENRRMVLESRADLYEAFGEDGLALEDLRAARDYKTAEVRK